MSKLLIMELWVAAQLFINLVLAMLLWRFVRKLKKIEIEILHDTFKRDDIKNVTDSIHHEVVERIDKLVRDMGEKAAVEMVDRAAKDIIDLLDPLVKGSESTAAFEQQIKEKKRLIKNLNDNLDSRITSINLLLSRSEVILNSKDKSIYQHQSSTNRQQSNGNENFSSSNSSWSIEEDLAQEKSEESVADQQKKIVQWYQQGLDIDTIASKLSMPRGEVQLVISLKEKIMNMER